jgi:hypothetical protein
MAKINLSKIFEAADTVAKYSDQQLEEEIFMGYEIVALTPVKAEAESDSEFEAHELFELTTATWFLLLGQVYNTPETISRRLLRWTLTVQDILNYKPEYYHGGISVPEGECEILEFNELIVVSSGQVPDVVVDALCKHLQEKRGDYLAEDYAEAYKNNALPNWDPRILKVIKDACLKFGD